MKKLSLLLSIATLVLSACSGSKEKPATEAAQPTQEQTEEISDLKTQPGQKYIDFTLEQPDGKKASLSEYLAKDSYTIIDFWASWCGPCRAEIPNLIALYDKYHAKGLQVVGIDVWEREEGAGEAAVKDMKIPYPVMYNGTQETTDLYGIQYIPMIMIIGPDGQIVAQDIRGEALAAKIADLMK